MMISSSPTLCVFTFLWHLFYGFVCGWKPDKLKGNLPSRFNEVVLCTNTDNHHVACYLQTITNFHIHLTGMI